MEQQNFSTSFTVNQSPDAVFNAINQVRSWWSENIEGGTTLLNDEFVYHYKDVHWCRIRIVESVPGKKVTWLVLDNRFNFTKNEAEWKGNRIVFNISIHDGLTRLEFSQEGLVPAYECYEVCRDAWTSYIQGSLKSLITLGNGQPNTKEHDLNRELIEKWGLPDK